MLVLNGTRSCVKMSKRCLSCVKLSFDVFGSQYVVTPPLLMVHGLFGNKSNWGTVPEKLCEKLKTKVYTVDLRNHGDSPRADNMKTEEVIGDLENFLTSEILTGNCNRVTLWGHSYGGKLVCLLALRQPQVIDRLILEDVAPRSYQDSAERFVASLRAVAHMDLTQFTSLEVLAQSFPHKPTRDFLIMNLKFENGLFHWKTNIPVIEKYLLEVTGIADGALDSLRHCGPVLSVVGEQSPYVRKDDVPLFHKYFPNFSMVKVQNSGHWIHNEQPEKLIEIAYKFYQGNLPNSKL